ncbi:hypothetical protein BKA64DRAFT_701651 [Cadophora sp. MPI-SDFR-AT-0126]|nr:hypothetical protein BKA64DRAFT_701651 [Leotiomycetes sp. MPI-SDFR-AT-0126]
MIVNVTAQTRVRARSRAIPSPHNSRGKNSPAALVSPSQLPIIIQNFLSQFLDYFASRSSGSPGRFWLHELPSISINGVRNGLELAVQATSTVFCANSTSNPSYYVGSRQFYGEALGRHSRSVAALQNSTSQSATNSTAEVLCTTLLLGFYEAISSTQAGGEGYMRHVEGAAKMVEILGPDNCAGALVNELFFTARTQMLLISFLTKKPSIYATPQYLQIPHHNDTKPIHEHLMEILTLLIEGLHFPSHDQIQHPIRGPEFLNSVETRLEELWIEFRTCYYPSSLSEPEIGEATSTANLTTASSDYPNAFTAYITSYFSLARILYLVITSRTTLPLQNLENDEVIHRASATILSCAAYLETQNLGCGFIRAVLPLLVAGIHGCVDDRRAARVVLERWKGRGIVQGLAGLVLGRLDGECGETEGSTRGNLYT